MSTISVAGGTQDLEYEFETCLARLYATDLVNELFDQFDHNPYAPEVLTDEILQLQAAVDPDFSHDLAAWDRPSDWERPANYVPYEPYSTALQSTQELSRAASVAAALPPASPPSQTGKDYRLLFAVACASLFSTFFLWMLSYFHLSNQLQVAQSTPVVSQPVVDPQTAAFASYLDQALETAGKSTDFPTASQPAPLPTNTASAPTVVAVATSALPNPQPKVQPVAGKPTLPAPPTVTTTTANGKPVERVYIPVYQPPATQATAPGAKPLPAPATAGIPLPPPPPTRVPASLSRYLPNSGQPAPTSVTTPVARPTTMAAVAPAPRPARPKAQARPGVPVAAVSDTSTNVILGNATLVGVMELGERSTALIETNGATQRLSIGQSLGTTGWQVVQIVDQKVVIQRGGEVRSLAVGQKF